MNFNFANIPELDDPLLGFRFGVYFLGGVGLAHPLDFRFQEVSGISVSRENTEGAKPEYQNLILKRGMPAVSTLRQEVLNAVTNESGERVSRNVLVSILDENALPIQSFLFGDATPVRWELSPLDANSNGVIIETIELSYNIVKPFSL